MTEQLYRKSWEPLSEANESECQVVRDKSFPNEVFIAYHLGKGWRWAHGQNKLLPGWGAGYHSYEFLCLTPVDSD